MMNQKKRVVSGMRSTGMLHLGHYHGVLKNWLSLQNNFECFFFAADWHALTTHYNETAHIEQFARNNIIDWLACGLDPEKSTVFIQSHVPEHAELHLLLSMITPVSWLERVPTYKEQQQKLSTRDLSTYGFLGYPLLQTADVLVYKASYIPVGEDQVPHIEFSREVARRFNHIYGQEKDFEEKLAQSLKKMSKQQSSDYAELRRKYQEQGDRQALEFAAILVSSLENLNVIDKERLLGAVEGNSKIILPEPEALLTATSKMPGLDGQKMSKSYNNTIMLREPIEDITKKIKTMPTDPARIKRTDPGTPEKCPVWELHKVYSDKNVQSWVQEGCTGAKIGCIECKQPVIAKVTAELEPIQERIAQYEKDPSYIKDIVTQGAEKAREVAKITLAEVKTAMGLSY